MRDSLSSITLVSQPLGVCGVEVDTQELARIAAAQPGQRALDLGTGTGYVAIYLAQAGWSVDAVDISPRAVAIAQSNIQNADVNVAVWTSDLFAAVTKRYHLIACNPPVNRHETEFTRLVTSTLRRVRPLARLLLRASFALRPHARHSFLVEVARAAQPHLEPAGRLLLVISAAEAAAITQTLPSYQPVETHPIPGLFPLTIAVLKYHTSAE